MLKKILMVLLFSGIAFSQVTKEEQTKILLAEFAIQLDETIKLNASLTKTINALVMDLKAIEEPSEELIAVLKKYGLYEVNNGDIPGKD